MMIQSNDPRFDFTKVSKEERLDSAVLPQGSSGCTIHPPRQKITLRAKIPIQLVCKRRLCKNYHLIALLVLCKHSNSTKAYIDYSIRRKISFHVVFVVIDIKIHQLWSELSLYILI